MKSRRQFIKFTGAGMMAAGTSFVNPLRVSPVFLGKTRNSFTIGIAGYTFREFDLERTIEIMKKAGVTNISLKDFHLPLNSTREQMATILQKFKNAEINVYAVGKIFMKTQESVDQAFDYAKMAGVSMIVAAPEYELLPYLHKKVKEYGFKIAIQNHGPGNPLYPNAKDIWDHVKDLDPRIGVCFDIGHATRDGQDPSVDLLKYKARMFDIHIKDVDRASKDGKTVEIGRGIIDIPKVVSTLRKIKYNGSCSLEFEKDMKDPLPGIAESIGYFRAVMDCEG
jgi:sugar phosphate isomerase/epimerase